MMYARLATFLTGFLLAGCGGGQLNLDNPSSAAAATGIAGHWFLAAPNAPPCGINFSSAPGASQGRIVPEGGCPGRFYLSRRWSLEGDTLTISDDDSQPLGQLKLAGAKYEGQAVTGMPVTLSR